MKYPVKMSSISSISIVIGVLSVLQIQNVGAIYEYFLAGSFCGEFNLVEDVIFKSPNYPKKFPMWYSCEMTMKSPPSTQITLHFTEFSTFAPWDYVKLKGGSLNARLWGRKPKGRKYTTDSNELTFIFKSRMFTSGRGFKVTISAAPKYGTCECGRRNVKGVKVINGEDTLESEYPWTVGIVEAGQTSPFCGGALINYNYVITAGHCTMNRHTSSIYIILGSSRWSSIIAKRRYVKKIIQHDDFLIEGKLPMHHDISLIQLDEPITFPLNNKIAAICMPYNSQFVDVVAIGAGWGTKNWTQGGSAELLQEVELTTMSNTACNTMTEMSFHEDNICAIHPTGLKNICKGDSGTSLMYPENGFFMSIGVSSKGTKECARPNEPTVYTRTATYINWIRANAGKIYMPGESYPCE